MDFGVSGGRKRPKKPSLATIHSPRENPRKCPSLQGERAETKRGLTAIAIRPRDKLGGGAEEIRTLDPHVANVVL